MYQIKKRQQGFTLLELLVVITLLAIISVGALVAYEGLGENAADTAAANNIKTADSSIRSYRAVTGRYPNQWDNLANLDGETTGGAADVLADATKEFLGKVAFSTENDTHQAVLASLAELGINELQTLQTTSVRNRPDLVSPNEFFNESAPQVTDPADELTWNADGDVAAYDGEAAPTFNVSIVPSAGAGTAACTLGGAAIDDNLEGEAVASSFLNRINDNLDDDGCHAVIALGFGKDVPGTTLDSSVAISTAPTYTSTNVNPSQHYARYIALFYVGSDDDGDLSVETEELKKPRLLAVVDTEGRNIDQAIAGAFAASAIPEVEEPEVEEEEVTTP